MEFNAPSIDKAKFAKWGVLGASFIAIMLTIVLTVGVNNNGYRTVIQWPSGTTWVKFTPGWYLSLFGTTVEYSDVITFDFDKLPGGNASINQQGIKVTYQDGGKGTIYGQDRFALPDDSESMLKVHKDFRTPQGLANKLIRPITEEATNLTAGLMESEEAYTTKRNTFKQWAKKQLVKGPFKTVLERRMVKGEDGKDTWKSVPVIAMDTKKQPLHDISDLTEYGITVSGHQITNWDFEQKTLDQISTKREATMAIITAKANAERAKQDAVTIEEQGKANVMKSKYEQEVLKEKAIVIAEREKQVATIKATQLVDVAEQSKLEAEQKKFAAAEYKQEQVLRGEGDGAYKRLVMEADGALAQKLATYETVNHYYAQAIANQKWVPEIQFGGASGDTGERNAAQDLLDMFMTKTAKDLTLDMSTNTTIPTRNVTVTH